MTEQSTWSSIQDDLAEIAARLQQVTVQVQGHRSGMGSGVIWQSNGLIITNAHVVSGNRATVELWDGRRLEATVTDRDDRQDLAVLQVQATNLPAAAIATDIPRVGELVVAVGNPLGLVGALTTGIIHSSPPSATNPDWIRADIRLAPGNSGGALANARGQVIGINSMIVNGLGYAIPSANVSHFLQQQGNRPHLGVVLRPVLVPLHRQRHYGLLILDITVGSAAAIAQLLPGDILIGVAGKLFSHSDDLFTALNRTTVGKTLQLDFIRNGQRRVVEIILQGRSVQENVA